MIPMVYSIRQTLYFLRSNTYSITFPLLTTEITEPRLALRQISSVNYSAILIESISLLKSELHNPPC